MEWTLISLSSESFRWNFISSYSGLRRTVLLMASSELLASRRRSLPHPPFPQLMFAAFSYPFD